MAISTFEADEIVARANVNQRINQANAYFPVSVANGGTGRTSLTSGQILLGNGTSGITGTDKLPVTKGGTGRQELAAGQILIGNGTGGIIGTSILPISKGGTGVNDFYETGSWTPSTPFAATSVAYKYGYYVRIRDWVYVTFRMKCNLSSTASAYGSASIGGLPFAVNNVGGNVYYPASLIEHSNMFTTGGNLAAYFKSNVLWIMTPDGKTHNVFKDGASGAYMGFGGWYQKA